MSTFWQDSGALRLWRIVAGLAIIGGLITIGLGIIVRARGADQIVMMISSLTADGRLDDNYTYMLSGIDTALLLLGAVALLIGSCMLVGQRWRIGRSALLVSWSSARFLTVFGGLSLLLNVAVIANVPFTPWDDFEWYHQSAINLLAGSEIRLGERPTAFFPIGYPAFLAPFYVLFGPHLIVAQILNMLLRLGTAVAIYFIALQATQREQIARGTYIFVAFFPSLFFYTLVTCSDVLFMAISILLLRLMISMERLTIGRTVVLGLLVGIGSSVRSVLVLFPLVILIWYIVISRKPLQVLLHLLLVLVLQCAILTPWAYRNNRVFGQFVPLGTNGGYNLYLGHNPAATGGFNSTRIVRPQGQSDEVARDDWYREQAIAYIRSNPGRLVPITAKKMLYLFMRDDQGVSTATKVTYTAIPAARLLLATLVSDLYYCAVLGLAVFGGGALLLGRRGTRCIWLLLLYCAYHVGIYLPFFGMDRYHLPILPVLSLLAMIGLASWDPGNTQRRDVCLQSRQMRVYR